MPLAYSNGSSHSGTQGNATVRNYSITGSARMARAILALPVKCQNGSNTPGTILLSAIMAQLSHSGSESCIICVQERLEPLW